MTANAANYVIEADTSSYGYGPINSPAGEQYFKAVDGSTDSKYLNFNKTGAGITVGFANARIMRRLIMYTANDGNERDPMTINIYGSNTWDGAKTLIQANVATNLSTNRKTPSTIDFNNSLAYQFYTIEVTSVRNDYYANSFQFSEVMFYYDTEYNPNAPQYSSGITAAQTATRAAAQITRDSYNGNNIYIDQVGDNNSISILQYGNNNTIKGHSQENAQFIGSNNTIDIRQGAPGVAGKNLIEFDYNGTLNNIKLYQDRLDDGAADDLAAGNHIMRVNVSGNSNTVNSRQRNNSGPSGHYIDINVSGNSNNISTLQINDQSKTSFVNVNGSSNTVDLYQQGVASYYADIKLQGDGHNVTLFQTGTGEHKATIDLTNGGASGTVNVTQQGTTAQTYSIQQTCVSLPCGATVTQGQ